MTTTSTVVVPVDLASGLEHSIVSAVRVAELIGARRVHLVHVARDHPVWMRGLETCQAVWSSAHALVPPDSPIEVTREVRIGAPAREIVAAAQACVRPMIVIAKQNRTAVSRLVLGSVTHTVVRASHCPVLVLDPDQPWQRPKHVLAAIDLSRVSEDVLERSFELGSAAHACVTVLSVFDLAWLDPTWKDSATLPLEDSDRAAFADEHRAAIDSLIERLRTRDVQVTREIATQHPPAKAILERAEAGGLIVLGSSGHSTWDRLFLGSTATRVLAQAPCPVLVVPVGAPM